MQQSNCIKHLSSSNHSSSESPSLSISSTKLVAFKHEVPWHWTQAMEHSLPYSWQLQHTLVLSVVQLHLMIFKRTAWAGGFLVAIGCNSNAVHVQPHCYGCKLYSESFHWSIWRNTHLLWKLAASAVRDNYFGSTWYRLLATFSQYFLYLEAFRVSPFFP